MPRRRSSSSLAAQAAMMEPKNVSFDPTQDESHVIDLIPDDDLDRVFYTRLQIKELQQKEMAQIKKAVLKDHFMCEEDANGHSECASFTWRGVEDWKEGTPSPTAGRQAKVRAHVRHVLKAWTTQDLFGPTAAGETVDLQERWDQLRVVSKASSKESRAHAVKRATQDAQAAGVRRSSSATAAQLLKSMSSTVANPLKLMRLSLTKDSQRSVMSATA